MAIYADFCKKVVWCCISNQTGRSRSGGPPNTWGGCLFKSFSLCVRPAGGIPAGQFYYHFFCNQITF